MFYCFSFQTTEPEMQEQLHCILKIYNDPSGWQPMCDCDLGVEIENEIDLFEPELDEDDKFSTSGLSGEQLLYNYRLLFPINGNLNLTYLNVTLEDLISF